VADLKLEVALHSITEDQYIMASPKITTPGPSDPTQALADEAIPYPVLPAEAESGLEDPEQRRLPKSTLTFKMSEEIFRQAKEAAAGSPQSYWSYTLYRGPEKDGISPKVTVHYCRSKHTTERTLQYFLDKKVVGFDIEWEADSTSSAGAKKNVSLIQLASEDRIALFHIALFPKDGITDLVAPSLKKIMEDPKITKVGVAIKADCTRLRKYLNIHSQGLFELSHLYKLVKFSESKDFKLIDKRLVSLAKQVQEHLHLPLYKGEVRTSDWSQALQLDQISYAASDSYAGIHLYDTMEIKRKSLDPIPPRPYHAEKDKPIRLADGVLLPVDEAAEELEPEEIERPPVVRKTIRRYKSARAETLKTEMIDLDPSFGLSGVITPPSSKTKTSSSVTIPKPPKDPIVLAAEQALNSYRATHPESGATVPSLRAYFIWKDDPSLSIHDIAALLRETPLQPSTVVNYIVEAIRLEKLPFEKERLKGLLEVIPKEVVWGRYRTLAKIANDEQLGEMEGSLKHL